MDTRLRGSIENRKRFGTPSNSNEDENAAVIGENDKLDERVVFLYVWDAQFLQPGVVIYRIAGHS